MQINTNRKHSINSSNGFILFPSLSDQGESPLIENVHTYICIYTHAYNMDPSRSWPYALSLSSSWLLGFLFSPVAGSWMYKPLRLAALLQLLLLRPSYVHTRMHMHARTGRHAMDPPGAGYRYSVYTEAGPRSSCLQLPCAQTHKCKSVSQLTHRFHSLCRSWLGLPDCSISQFSDPLVFAVSGPGLWLL